MSLESRLDALFSMWKQGVCPGGQVLVRQHGKVLFQKNYGYANLEHEIPITSQTVFHVASVSKQITVLALLLLQEDGKVHIDDDIRNYVPDLIHFSEPVSVRQCMNNVSGIRDQWLALVLHGVRIDDTITQRDLKTIIAKQKKLNFAPGSKYLYSNSNFTLLAEIVERISGKSFSSFVEERIFKPLGMTHTVIRDTYWQMIPKKAYSYHDNGEGIFTWNVLNYGAYGATSLHTTAEDFMKILNNYRTPKVGSPATIDLMMHRPTLTDGTKSGYGGGLMLGEYLGHPYLEHGGADAAFRAHVMRFPDDDLDIVLFSNTQFTPMSLLARRVAHIILDINEEKPDLVVYLKEDSVRAKPGLYVNLEVPDVIHLTKDNGSLLKGKTPLHHLGHNRYRLGYGATEYLFTKEGLVSVTGPTLAKYTYLPDKEVVPEEALPLCGFYYSEEIETRYEILYRDGFLYVKHFRHGEHRLYRSPGKVASYFTWNTDFSGIFDFIADEKDRYTKILLSGGRILNLELNRVAR